ncbi:YlxR family protein [Metamycoplasma equirhinis]|uniref:YlxR family protein n=1 Tax=Metamycoplasma equirhinis TaxID=92402 RepID=UPI00359C1506
MKIDRRIYLRKSIVDSQLYEINNLLRFVKNKDGVISFDSTKTKPGRGAYCLNSQDQIEILFKKRLLDRAFKQNISIEIYNSMKAEVEKWIKEINEHQM